MWKGHLPITKNKTPNLQTEKVFGKSGSTISKIGSLSCGQLWLSGEVGAMVGAKMVFLVSALSTFDSPVEL